MNTPTPETDAHCNVAGFDSRQWYDFARKLERERNSELAKVERISTAYTLCSQEWIATCAERDQLRKVADSQNKILTRMLATYGYPRWGNEDIEVRETMSFYNNLLHIKK